MLKQTVVIAEMDNSDGTFESANRLYDKKYAAPTIPTCSGGGHQPKVIKKHRKPVVEKKISVIGGFGGEWGTQYKQQYRVIDKHKVSYALSAELQVAKVIKNAKNIRTHRGRWGER